MPTSAICLWFDGGAEEAAQFYAATFPDSAVSSITRAPGDYPSGRAGDVLMVEFTVLGTRCLGLNGGPGFPQTQAFSFQVVTDDQEQTDRYWDALTSDGGEESMCGWCRDRWGVWWQITPQALLDAMAGGGDSARRAFESIEPMRKLDIATIEAAARG